MYKASFLIDNVVIHISVLIGYFSPIKSPQANGYGVGQLLHFNNTKGFCDTEVLDGYWLEVAPRVGLEPTTNGLTVRRSTN